MSNEISIELLKFELMQRNPMIDHGCNRFERNHFDPYMEGGMPRLDKSMLEMSLGIYSFEREYLGVGFFVSRNDNERYLVTCKHLLEHPNFLNESNVFVQIGKDLLQFSKSSFFKSNAHDIAVRKITNIDDENIKTIGTNLFLALDKLDDEVGLGDETFTLAMNKITGDAKVHSEPHFGKISRIPDQNETRFYLDSSSRGGFSGAPVFSYRTPLDFIELEKSTFTFIGLHNGQHLEPVTDRKGNIVGNCWYPTGISFVTPSWHILETIDQYLKLK